MDMGRKLTLVFIDYSAAFDSLSHKFIDQALKETAAPAKIRVMFQVIYSSASTCTTVGVKGGNSARSNAFDVSESRDISPLFFIVALELILRRYDDEKDKGVTLADALIDVLGYADDAVMAEDGDEEVIQRISRRVTCISKGSKKDDGC